MKTKVFVLDIQRRVVKILSRPVMVSSGSNGILETSFQHDWSVTPQHGCSAEPLSKVRIALHEGCHVIIAGSHVSQLERIKKFATNICPPGLLGDSCSVRRPTSPRPHPMSLPFSHVSRLLAFVPVIIATFACSGETCKQ